VEEFEEVICDRTFIVNEAGKQLASSVEKARMVLDNIREFHNTIRSYRSEIEEALSKVVGLEADKKGYFIVADPTNRFFAVTRIAALTDYKTARVFYVEMKPPIIPHFFLITAYFALEANMTPAAIIRIEPVLTLMSLVTRGDKLVALATQLATGLELLENFVKGEASLLPFEKEFLMLPLEPDEENSLYLTTIGYSTQPLEDIPSVKLDFTDIPPFPSEMYSKVGFKPVTQIVKEIVGEIRNEFWFE